MNRNTLYKTLLFISVFILLERFTYFQTGGFSPYKIICTENIQTVNHLDGRGKNILDQPFHYLGKGVQFFVFESADSQYVLKFIKHHRTSPRFWFSQNKVEKRTKKIIQSCELAYHHLKNETGLVAIHLKPNSDEKHEVTLFDGIGIAHLIDLNQTSYILQKKGESLSKRPLTPTDIDSLIDLIKNRYEHGIVNKDPRPRNFGFVASTPFEIDLGSFTRPIPERLSHAFEKEQLKWKTWLETYDPALAEYFTLQMEN